MITYAVLILLISITCATELGFGNTKREISLKHWIPKSVWVSAHSTSLIDFYSFGDLIQWILGLTVLNVVVGMNSNGYIHLRSAVNDSDQDHSPATFFETSEWLKPRGSLFCGFGVFLHFPRLILLEFCRIFLTWVNRVLEMLLYLRIQVKANIAPGRREQWSRSPWPLRKSRTG